VPLPGVELLTELALDLHWAWNHSADGLWGRLEPELWAVTHNPWVVLQTASKAKLEDFLGRPEYRKRVETLLADRRRHLAGAERRLQQELVLGVGGWRLLRALGLEPEVCHLNEGHAALAVLAPRFSTNRVLREYTERYYLPAAAAYRKRGARKGALAARLVAWQRRLVEHWDVARFGALRVETRGDQHQFAAEVYLGGLDPNAIRVELYANPVAGDEPLRQAMKRGRELGGSDAGYEYRASVPASRPAGDYTPRLVPHHPEAGTPLEAPHILWQR